METGIKPFHIANAKYILKQIQELGGTGRCMEYEENTAIDPKCHICISINPDIKFGDGCPCLCHWVTTQQHIERLTKFIKEYRKMPKEMVEKSVEYLVKSRDLLVKAREYAEENTAGTVLDTAAIKKVLCIMIDKDITDIYQTDCLIDEYQTDAGYLVKARDFLEIIKEYL